MKNKFSQPENNLVFITVAVFQCNLSKAGGKTDPRNWKWEKQNTRKNLSPIFSNSM